MPRPYTELGFQSSWDTFTGATPATARARTVAPAIARARTVAPALGLAGGALSASDVAYLKDRSLRFQQTLSDLIEAPFGDALQSNDGREAVAMLAATALVGDDMNYATGQPSVGWNQAKWLAAFHLVKNNVVTWFTQAFPSAPVPGP